MKNLQIFIAPLEQKNPLQGQGLHMFGLHPTY